ncbi:MAG: hypothetical protein U0002_13600 [Thermoanaerobaculia bacterium]
MAPDASTCPRCGKPRFAISEECPFCGIVFARYRQTSAQAAPVPPPAAVAPAAPVWPPALPAQPEPTPNGLEAELWPAADEPEPDDPPESEDLYQGPSLEELQAARAAPARPVQRVATAPLKAPNEVAPPRLSAFGRLQLLVQENLGISLIAAALLFLVAQMWWYGSLVGEETDSTAVHQQFTDVTGLDPPEGLDHAVGFRFFGWKLLLLENPESEQQVTADNPFGGVNRMVAVERSAAAESPALEALRAQVNSTLRGQLERFGLPYGRISEGSRTVREGILADRYWLGPQEKALGRVSAMVFAGAQGRASALVWIGESSWVQSQDWQLLYAKGGR